MSSATARTKPVEDYVPNARTLGRKPVTKVDFRPNEDRKHTRGKRGAHKLDGFGAESQMEFELFKKDHARRFSGTRERDRQFHSKERSFAERGLKTRERKTDKQNHYGYDLRELRDRKKLAAEVRLKKNLEAHGKKHRTALISQGVFSPHPAPKPIAGKHRGGRGLSYKARLLLTEFRKTHIAPELELPPYVDLREYLTRIFRSESTPLIRRLINALLMRAGIEPNPGPVILLYGPPSSGKSTLVAELGGFDAEDEPRSDARQQAASDYVAYWRGEDPTAFIAVGTADLPFDVDVGVPDHECFRVLLAPPFDEYCERLSRRDYLNPAKRGQDGPRKYLSFVAQRDRFHAVSRVTGTPEEAGMAIALACDFWIGCQRPLDFGSLRSTQLARAVTRILLQRAGVEMNPGPTMDVVLDPRDNQAPLPVDILTGAATMFAVLLIAFCTSNNRLARFVIGLYICLGILGLASLHLSALRVLLVRAGVEMNPGPTHRRTMRRAEAAVVSKASGSRYETKRAHKTEVPSSPKPTRKVEDKNVCITDAIVARDDLDLTQSRAPRCRTCGCVMLNEKPGYCRHPDTEDPVFSWTRKVDRVPTAAAPPKVPVMPPVILAPIAEQPDLPDAPTPPPEYADAPPTPPDTDCVDAPLTPTSVMGLIAPRRRSIVASLRALFGRMLRPFGTRTTFSHSHLTGRVFLPTSPKSAPFSSPALSDPLPAWPTCPNHHPSNPPNPQLPTEGMPVPPPMDNFMLTGDPIPMEVLKGVFERESGQRLKAHYNDKGELELPGLVIQRGIVDYIGDRRPVANRNVVETEAAFDVWHMRARRPNRYLSTRARILVGALATTFFASFMLGAYVHFTRGPPPVPVWKPAVTHQPNGRPSLDLDTAIYRSGIISDWYRRHCPSWDDIRRAISGAQRTPMEVFLDQCRTVWFLLYDIPLHIIAKTLYYTTAPWPIVWFLLRKPRRVVIHFAPHLVTSVVSEFARGTNLEAMSSTIRAKFLRLATFPLPDEMYMTIIAGSEAVVLEWAQSQTFFTERVVAADQWLQQYR